MLNHLIKQMFIFIEHAEKNIQNAARMKERAAK